MGVLVKLQVGAPEVDQHHGQKVLQIQKGGEVTGRNRGVGGGSTPTVSPHLI